MGVLWEVYQWGADVRPGVRVDQSLGWVFLVEWKYHPQDMDFPGIHKQAYWHIVTAGQAV
ncbi:hypothetical protein B5J93_13145 [Moraxella equi]|uniref:Uncharacterized protein n=1 Tax=Moraxella equi TaxID=60442 RepID=A0ABX3NEF4_9GAMM|nr:hypothetical protein B5J93_13145 [Moraxella equi]